MGLDQTIIRLGEEENEGTEVAYFRKVNFLHLWVEQHLNGGESTNCDEVPMHLEAIAGLAQTCTQVLHDPSRAPELLPTTSGFFFGSTDYDDGYLLDVARVRDVCRSILEHEATTTPPGSGRYAYWSWW